MASRPGSSTASRTQSSQEVVLLRGRKEVQRHRVQEGVLLRVREVVLPDREALLRGPEGVLQEVVLLCRRVLLHVCEGVPYCGIASQK